MIWLFLSCFESQPSALDKRFCEDRCEAAGAETCSTGRWMPLPRARTEVSNGDILCTCYFSQGTVRPPQDAIPSECSP